MRPVPLTLLSVTLSFGLACRPPPPSAETSYRTFAAAVENGDENTAWALLSKSTQAEFEHMAKSVAVFDATKSVDGKAVAFGQTLQSPRSIKSVQVKQDGTERKILNVTDSSEGLQEIVTVFEDGRWRIDLTEQLRRAKP